MSATVQPRPDGALRTTAGLASALRIKTMRLARRLRQVHAQGPDLSANQLSTMGTLMRAGELTMTDLAELEMVRPPSMTRTVNSLVEAGMVERRACSNDRRQSQVRLTAAGAEVVQAERRRRDQWLARGVAELSPGERTALREALPILEKLAAG